ncbi:hypothetical protein M0O54_20215, partial [Acinetobacter lactucae]
PSLDWPRWNRWNRSPSRANTDAVESHHCASNFFISPRCRSSFGLWPFFGIAAPPLLLFQRWVIIQGSKSHLKREDYFN